MRYVRRFGAAFIAALLMLTMITVASAATQINADGYYVAAFPKIAFPLLDFCFDYVNMEIEENKKTLLT